MPDWRAPALIPDLDAFRAHRDKHGLDKNAKDRGKRGSWVESKYRTYNQLSQDSLFEVAKFYLPREDYLTLVREYGGPKFVKQAIEQEGWQDDGDGEVPEERRGVPARGVRRDAGNESEDAPETSEGRARTRRGEGRNR